MRPTRSTRISGRFVCPSTPTPPSTSTQTRLFHSTKVRIYTIKNICTHKIYNKIYIFCNTKNIIRILVFLIMESHFTIAPFINKWLKEIKCPVSLQARAMNSYWTFNIKTMNFFSYKFHSSFLSLHFSFVLYQTCKICPRSGNFRAAASHLRHRGRRLQVHAQERQGHLHCYLRLIIFIVARLFFKLCFFYYFT